MMRIGWFAIGRLGASARHAPAASAAALGKQLASCQHSVYSASCAIDELYLRNYFKPGR